MMVSQSERQRLERGRRCVGGAIFPTHPGVDRKGEAEEDGCSEGAVRVVLQVGDEEGQGAGEDEAGGERISPGAEGAGHLGLACAEDEDCEVVDAVHGGYEDGGDGDDVFELSAGDE